MTYEIPRILERSEDVPIAEIRYLLRTGSVSEPPELAGVGRLALRLLRRGTAELGRKALDEEVDRIAAVLSAQSTPDYYALHFRSLTRHLDRAVELFSEVINRPTLDPEELERLKRETVAEIVSSRDDDRHLASRALRLLIFGDHPYGRPSRGSIETVERVSPDDVKRFLDAHLLAANTLVGASGDLTEDGLAAVLPRTIGQRSSGTPPQVEQRGAERVKGVRVMLVDKPNRTQTQILLGHLGPEVKDPLDLPLRVALTAFGGTFTSKLMQEVRVKRGWSYGAYASLGRGRMPEVLNLWAFPALSDARACLELLLKLFRDLWQDGPSAGDISFARDYLARGMALQRDTAAARLTLRLRQVLLDLPEDYYDTYPERVRAVTVEQCVEAVRTHLDPENLAIAMTCTADKVIDQVRSVVGEDAAIETIPYDSPVL